MKERKLATRYARALLSSLREPALAERAEAFLLELGAAFERFPDLRTSLLNPAVPASTRKSALGSIASDRAMPAQLVRFLETVVDNGRIAELPSIGEAFREQRQRAQGIVSATIATPTPLPPDLEERARVALERLTGKKVRLTCTIDRDLIGGGVARIGSTVYDGSLRTQLAKLRRKMAEE